VNGASHFAYRLASGLAERGHDVHVICPSATADTSTAVSRGVTVHRLGAIRTPFHPTFRVCPPWRAAKALPSLLTGIRPDLVHTQAHFLIGRSAVRAASAAGIPVVATNHFMPENLFGYGPLPGWSHRALSRLAWRDLVRIFRDATVVTAPTPRAVKLLEDNGLAGPAMAISCGIDRGHFRPPPMPSSDDSTILFVGRLDAEKNVHELLSAAALLPPETRVELIGDGSERRRLEALAAELGIRDRVRFRGFVSDDELLRAYQRCDVFCMPGTAELQSLATMEAMAAGRPIVAADAMALPHLVRSGRNGWLYQPGDVTGLAARLADVLGDTDALAAMGKASLDLIAAHDIENTMDTFEKLYLDVLGAPAPAAIERAELAV
jgi:glycosyltransferase involved in cell wall biosynthesis